MVSQIDNPSDVPSPPDTNLTPPGADPVMDSGLGIVSRAPLDRTSLRYPDKYYSGVCRASKSLLLEFLKTSFGNLGNDHPFYFHEDQNCSRINIVDRNTFNLEQVDKRPAIVVHRNQVIYQKVARTQKVSDRRLQRKEEDPAEMNSGQTLKTGLLTGNMVIRCYGKGTTLQAELLGESVFELITDMEDVLKKIGFFECYANAIGEEQTVEGQSKNRYMMVPVSVTFSMQRSWTIITDYMRKLQGMEHTILGNAEN